MTEDERLWLAMHDPRTARETAAGLGHPRYAPHEWLIRRGVDPNVVDADGRTALHHTLAPFGGDPDHGQWLVEAGVDPSIRDKRGQTAVEYGSSQVSSGAEMAKLEHFEDWLRSR